MFGAGLERCLDLLDVSDPFSRCLRTYIYRIKPTQFCKRIWFFNPLRFLRDVFGISRFYLVRIILELGYFPDLKDIVGRYFL